MQSRVSGDTTGCRMHAVSPLTRLWAVACSIPWPCSLRELQPRLFMLRRVTRLKSKLRISLCRNVLGERSFRINPEGRAAIAQGEREARSPGPAAPQIPRALRGRTKLTTRRIGIRNRSARPLAQIRQYHRCGKREHENGGGG